MKSITIHKLDDLLVQSIEAQAKEKGESLNATIKRLLAQALNIDKNALSESPDKKGYRRFLGKWSSKDAAEFAEAAADFEKIDKADWQG